jgi:3-phenylpropionate/trans-cinnamate dioxygenase ferredoxin component
MSIERETTIGSVVFTQGLRKSYPRVIMAEFIKVATVDEVPTNSRKLVEIDGVRVALFNLGGKICAIEDVCTHDGGPLVEGTIVNGCEIMCPRHGARFDICTGQALSFPAFESTNTYTVRVEGNDIWMESPV